MRTFTEIDPWADRVADFLSDQQQSGDLPVKIPAILDALAVPSERQDNRAARRVRQIAESLGWWVAQRRHQGKIKKGLWPPAEPRAVTTVSPPVTTNYEKNWCVVFFWTKQGHTNHARQENSGTFSSFGGDTLHPL